MSRSGRWPAIAGLTLQRWLGSAPPWIPAVPVLTVVISDLIAYPRMRRYYRSEPAARRIVGENGEAVTSLAPSGYARVHGELWRATWGGRFDRGGCGVRVTRIRGLRLIVERTGR